MDQAYDQARQELRKAQHAALHTQGELDAIQADADEHQARLIPAKAYVKRLADLEDVLKGYIAALQGSLSRLGVDINGEHLTACVSQGQLSAAQAAFGQAVLQAVDDETFSMEQLLGQAESIWSIPAVAAPAPAVLEELLAQVQAACAQVESWNRQHSSSNNSGSSAPSKDLSEAGSVAAAVAGLQRMQIGRYKKSQEKAGQQRELEEQVAAARAAAAAGGPSGALLAAAAKQAGLQAGLAQVEALKLELQNRQAKADEEGEAVLRQMDELAALEDEERELDAQVRALTAASVQLAQCQRQGSFESQALVEEQLLPLAPLLAQLAEQLPGAVQAELAAFCAMPWKPEHTLQPALGRPQASTAKAAAQLLDPLAALKSEDCAAEVLESAREELAQLQPVLERWAVLAAAAEQGAAALQADAGEVGGQLQELERDAGASMGLLKEAAHASAAGQAAVIDVRSALSEWSTSPALLTVPWVLHDGRNAGDWLRVLKEQQEQLARRSALGDYSNRY